MDIRSRAERGLLFLGLLALFQVSVLVFRGPSGPDLPGRWLVVGDTLEGLTARAGLFPAPDRKTVILAFNSGCGPCQRVAPVWATWAEGELEGIDLLGVSDEPIESARAFAERHGWPAKLQVMAANDRKELPERLVKRTPWVFVLDGSGRVVAEGHGTQVADLVAGAVTTGRTGGGP